MNLNLEGKVALITGGARDVGRETALAFAAEGATVAVNFRSSENAAGSVVGEITEKGGTAKAYQADVTDLDAVRAMIDAIIGDFGRIDILVNNAGYVEPRRFLETGPEDWKRQIDVGLYGVIHCCSAVGAHMVERGRGRIVNLAGDSARIGERFLSVTTSARGGVLSLTKSLAKELGPAGVTVNAVALGYVETAHSDREWLEKNREKIVRQYPLRRIGKPEDVAPAIVFLASGGAGWITGQVLSISGGYSMVG